MGCTTCFFQKFVVHKWERVYAMSFFSRSSRRKPYKYGNHGNQHYQRKGLLGKLFHILGSGSHSDKYHNKNPQQYGNNPNANRPNQNAAMCNKCNAQILAGSKFCLECGEKVNEKLFCTNCGENLPSNAKFCLKCGTKTTS